MRGLMAMLIVALAVLLANGWLKRWIQYRKSRPQKMSLQNDPARGRGGCGEWAKADWRQERLSTNMSAGANWQATAPLAETSAGERDAHAPVI